MPEGHAAEETAAPMFSRVAVVGAGAMGALFAARIAEQGVDVVLADIDRDRLDLLDREGIRLVDDRGDRAIRVGAADPRALRADRDLVMLFTKSMHTRSAVSSVVHLAEAGASVLTLQNGLTNPDEIAEMFPRKAVLKGIAALPADLVGENGVETRGSGVVEIGPLEEQGRAAAQAAAALLARSGFDARLNEDVDVAIWEKVAFNAALNAIAAVTGRRNGGMDNGPGRRIATSVVDETVATAHAAGAPVDRERILGEIDRALTAHPHHRASMLQDRLAGRSSEIEAINGAICARASALGVSTPVTGALADLVRLLETAEV